MNTSVAMRKNDNEVITRGILREVLEDGVEKKIDSVGVKLEDMDKQLVFLYKRFDSLDEQSYTLTYEVRIEYPKYIQSMFEDTKEGLREEFRFGMSELREGLRNEFRVEMSELRAEMNSRFEAVNARFDAVNARFDALEEKIDNFISFFGRYIKSNEDDKVVINRRVDLLEAEVF